MQAEINEDGGVSLHMSREEAQYLANICDAVDGTGPHVAASMGLEFAMREIGIVGSAHTEITNRLICK